MSEQKPTTKPTAILRTGTLALLGLLCLVGFHESATLYEGFPIPYGVGIYRITAKELVFFSWYLLFGALSVGFFTAALTRTAAVDRLRGTLGALFESRWFLPVALAVLLIECLVFQHATLKHMPIADDEDTYLFIARTLLTGRLVNPSPGDVEFFANQFIVHKGGAWFGKYPLGYPLLIAPFEALGVRFLLGPLLTAGTAWLTHLVGCRILSRRRAGLALVLLMLSPHFVFMGATGLSHTAMALFTVAGVLATIEARRRGLLFALLAGTVWGYGILIRPLPGVLLVPVVVAALLADREPSLRVRLGKLTAGAIPVLVAIALLFVINKIQTGSASQSSYHLARQAAGKAAASGLSGLRLFDLRDGHVALSVGGALLRENFWLLGWPLSFAFVFFARFRSERLLIWGAIAAVYAYRFVAPKTCVATLGPVYVTEAIPLLLLATADGAGQLAGRLRRLVPALSRSVPSLLIASTIVCGLGFLPLQLASIHRSSKVRADVLGSTIGTAGPGSLVFADVILPPRSNISWAIHPPNPSPSLDDPVIFVRPATGPDAMKKNRELWRRRFPDRRAWMFGFSASGVELYELPRDSASKPSAGAPLKGGTR